MPALVPESVLQDFHHQGSSFPLAGEQRARQGEAAVLLSTIPVSGRCGDVLAADGKEIRGRDQAQVGIARNLASPVAGALGKIAFGKRLQPPGDSSEKMLPVPGSRLFLKHFPILPAQTCQGGPAQVLNFHQYRVVHSFLFLSKTSTTVTSTLCAARKASQR